MQKKAGQLLERAISIAVEAHRGQKDRNGAPYILHPLRMMCRVDTETEKIVAVLHDVVEDTDWTFKDLKREGFGDQILKALDCLTKREAENYGDFVRRSASDDLARRVKIADLEDNMDVRRLRVVSEKDRERLGKYLRAWRQLTRKDGG